MTTQELLKKVQHIELKTKRLTNNLFMGEYHSSFKGRGMTFSEVRPYQYGDDVRNIDWNKTAHFNETYVKVFEEERELTLMLIVDISASQDFGTRKQAKKDTVAEVCATLAFSAMANNDKVGLILYANDVELYLPPKKGRFHALRIIRELVDFKATTKNNNLSKTLEFLLRTQKRRAVCFIISDFLEEDYSKKLQIAAQKHTITGIRIFDEKEQFLPNVGLINVQDPQTGEMQMVNTSSKSVRLAYEEYYRKVEDRFNESFSKAGASGIQIQNDADYVKALLGFFKKQGAA